MRVRLFLLCFAVLFASVMPIRSASASVLQFEVSGADNFSFLLDSSPVGFDGINAFYVTNVPNTSGHPVFEILAFFLSDVGGGLLATPYFTEDPDVVYFNLFGPQIFSGSTDSAMFSPGVFELTNPLGESDVLRITAVPELSTWVMMIIGFVAIGVMTRRFHKVASVAL